MQPPQIPPSDPDYVRATVALVDWDQASVPWCLSPFGRAHTRRAYQNAPRMAALNAGRELTPAEVEAFMELSFNMLSAQNVAGTVCTALPAYYFWRRGMARFSFPFWRPEAGGATNTRIDPNTLRLPLQPRPLLTGVRARAAWHGLRFAAYWTAAALMAGGAASAVAAGVVASRGNTDPRLEQWRADCLARLSSSKQQQPPPMLPFGFPRPSPAPFPRQHEQQQPPSYGGGSGGGGDDGSSWRPDGDGAPLSSPAPRPAQPLPRRDSDGFDDPFDDGSPVEPSYRRPSSAGPDTGGSTWDRLRRESANRAADQGSREASSWDAKRASAARGGGDNDESWSYSNPGGSEADTDRERAQKEFDEMLERERRSQSGGRS